MGFTRDEATTAGSTCGSDFGGLHRGPFEGGRLAAGFNAQNLGPEMEFGRPDQSEPLGRDLKVGVAATLPLTIGTDGFEVWATAAFGHDHSWVTSGWNVENLGAGLHDAYRRTLRVAARAGYHDDDQGEISDAAFDADAAPVTAPASA